LLAEQAVDFISIRPGADHEEPQQLIGQKREATHSEPAIATNPR
jgi:hypothetical protein